MTITEGTGSDRGISDELKRSLDVELKNHISDDISGLVSIYEIGVIGDEVCVWLRTSDIEKVAKHLLTSKSHRIDLDDKDRPGHGVPQKKPPYRELSDTLFVRFAKQVSCPQGVSYTLILDIFQLFENEKAASKSFERLKTVVRKNPSAKVL